MEYALQGELGVHDAQFVRTWTSELDVATVISMDIMGNQWKTVCNSCFSSDMSDIFYVLEILIWMRVYSEWLASSHHGKALSPPENSLQLRPEQLSLGSSQALRRCGLTSNFPSTMSSVDSTAENHYVMGKWSENWQKIWQNPWYFQPSAMTYSNHLCPQGVHAFPFANLLLLKHLYLAVR